MKELNISEIHMISAGHGEDSYDLGYVVGNGIGSFIKGLNDLGAYIGIAVYDALH